MSADQVRRRTCKPRRTKLVSQFPNPVPLAAGNQLISFRIFQRIKSRFVVHMVVLLSLTPGTGRFVGRLQTGWRPGSFVRFAIHRTINYFIVPKTYRVVTDFHSISFRCSFDERRSGPGKTREVRIDFVRCHWLAASSLLS